MPRPFKWRRVAFIPDVRCFIPAGVSQCELEENILKIEELEALRLKDLEKLEQEEGAARMAVSRQTFQRILVAAREKVADALIQGKAIRIEGGNFISYGGPATCQKCQQRWTENDPNYQKIVSGKKSCPHCGSKEIRVNPEAQSRLCAQSYLRHGDKMKSKSGLEC